MHKVFTNTLVMNILALPFRPLDLGPLFKFKLKKFGAFSNFQIVPTVSFSWATNATDGSQQVRLIIIWKIVISSGAIFYKFLQKILSMKRLLQF